MNMQPFEIRAAVAGDVPTILALIRELAAYEREPDAVHATEADLLRDGFSEDAALPVRFRCVVATSRDVVAGFALYFHNYSTWRGRAGIHLEDIFVRPPFRGQGIGKALLSAVAAVALREGCGRLQWDVLEWNKPAIDFYEKMGARMLDDWRIMRVDAHALPQLADASAAQNGITLE